MPSQTIIVRAHTRTIYTRPVTFVCCKCGEMTTRECYPGKLPKYCIKCRPPKKRKPDDTRPTQLYAPRVRLKMEVLWLKSQGLPHKEIARLTCIGQTTLRCYLKEYISGGITRLKQLTFYRPESKLVAHQEKIKLYFQ